MTQPSSLSPALAWRNIWRNRRRTAITLFGISFGVLLAVVFNGITDGTYSDLIDIAARLGNGHVIVQHPGYQEQPMLTKTIVATEALQTRIADDPRVAQVVRRMSGQMMLATAKNSAGVGFIALDPTRESARTFTLGASIKRGQMFASANDNGIVIGKDLAETLGADLGNKIVYTFTDKHGEIVSGLARLSGILETGAPTADGGLVILPIDTLAARAGYTHGEVTQLAVFLHDNRDCGAVARALGTQAMAALPWYEAQPELAGIVSMKRASSLVMQVIILVMLAAGIFNTLLMSVLERQREFGVMMAIGFSAPQLFLLVIWECVWVALSGLAAAALVTIGPYLYLHAHGIDGSRFVAKGSEVAGVTFDPTMSVNIYGIHLLGIAVAVVVGTLLAGLYPAWRAGRAVPAEVIRIV